MALSRLLQANSALRFCRLGFSAARARYFSDRDSDSQLKLKDESGEEGAKMMSLELTDKEAMEKLDLPKATSLGNVMVEYGGPYKPKTLSDIIMSQKEVPNETVSENEMSEHVDTLLDYLDRSERDESTSRSNDCQKGRDPEYFSTISANDRAATDVQKSDKHDRSNLLPFSAETSTIEEKETNKSSFDAAGLKEQNGGLKFPLFTSNKDQKQRQKKNSSRTESQGNKVLVRFLKSSVSESQIFEYFSSCGEIVKIVISNPQGLRFRTCYIDFKTTDGFEKAIARSGTHSFGPIIVESATSQNRTTTIPIPSLLGDHDIPAALVKNPTRTIRIEPLTEDISSHHIVEALAFCKSSISGYFLGPSNSVAYVEFETDIGKERALTKQSINVLERHLVMLRIDCPRTTAVRISSTGYLAIKDVMSICKSLGDIRSSSMRAPGVLDVHFKLAEWPNMLKILNRLNGYILEGRSLQAAPAPVFPPEVLLALWHHPEERKHLKAAAQALLHKLDSTLATSELAFLENDFFSM